MNFDRLRIFLAVARAGTVTAAADDVNLSQPAVSRNLKLLEENLGVELFRRAGRGLELTSAGRMLANRGESLMDEVGALEHEARRVARQDYFDLRLGTVDSVATYLFPQVVRPLKQRFPDLEIKFFTARTQQLLDDLDDGELDMAILAWSGAPPLEHVERVGRYDLQFYGRADLYPDLPDVTDSAGLDAYPIVQLRPMSGQPSAVEGSTESYAIANSIATIKALVLAGFGVGSLLQFTLMPEERARLVQANVPHDPDCGVYLARHARWRGEGADAIFEQLRESLSAAFEATD
jgi:DNA-binding transcriptional LysR family regulator